MKKSFLFWALAFFIAVNYSMASIPPVFSVYITCNTNGCQVACNESSGSLTAQTMNGIPPFTYLWSTAATSPTISNLPVGTYTVTVYDNVGDTAYASTNITNFGNQLEATPVAIPYTIFSCDNQCTGWIRYDSYYLYGTPPYTVTTSAGTVNYNPYTPGAEFTIENICLADSFAVTVTDALGCTGQSTNMSPFGLPNDYVFNPVLSVTPSCFSMANGSIEVTDLGTTWYYDVMVKLTTDTNTAYNPNNLYDWMTGGPLTFNNLLPGTYYLGVIFNYTYPADAQSPGCNDFYYCYHGCPKYVAVTVPDLGPNCSTVEGDVFMDVNANCAQDSGDAGVPGAIIEFTPGPYYAYTDISGHYSAALLWGNYNVAHYPPSYATPFCPTTPVPISLSFSNLTDTVNFADTNSVPFVPPVIPYDVDVYLGNTTAHPGFNFVYGFIVHNPSYTASGMITATLDYDPLLSFVSANPVPFSTSPGQVVWHLSSITHQSINPYVTLSVPPNPSLIGDTLTASVNVQTVTLDTNLANNTSSIWHIIMGPVDPNVKTVESPPASFIPALDSVFNYTIQFQNTGNDTAINIEVIDTLDSDLNVLTFVPGASSHPYTPDITGQGVLHFHFNNILLPDSTTDEPHSHGFVSFQIRARQNLAHGTTINNTSNIVFDFNPPVNTNTTTNTVDLTLAINASGTTICSGQSVTLTMIPELQSTPWRWRAGNCSSAIIGSGNSINVSPSVTTTYFVRDSAGTIPVGNCYRKTIIVNPSPTASITPSGPTTFCQGNSVTLSSSAASSYLWSNSSSTQSINVTSSGNYSVTVTGANGCTASSSAVSVTVNPLPNASITPGGPTTFCQGNSVTLTSSSASSYLWSNSSTTQNINVTSSGNYMVTVTDANNCTASSSVISVTVNPLPTASISTSGPTTFCQGDSVTLTSTAASSYLWSDNSTTQSIIVTSSGSYIVTVTDINNCSSASATTVTVNPNPPAPTITQAGDSLTSDAATTYQWYFNSGLIPGATSQSYHPLQNGNYSVVISDANNCTASSTDYPWVLTDVGNLKADDEVHIYPNPAGDELVVWSSEYGDGSEIIIYSLLGENLLSQKPEARSKKQVINLSGLSTGIYFLEIRTGKGISRSKFIKQP